MVLWLQEKVSGCTARSAQVDNRVVNLLIASSLNFRFVLTQSFAFNRNRTLKGIFPKSYVHLVSEIEIIKNEYVIKRSEIVDEITTVLKEWHGHFKRFYLVS